MRRFEGLEHDAERRRLISAAVAIEQAQELEPAGVAEFHLYTLNRSSSHTPSAMRLVCAGPRASGRPIRLRFLEWLRWASIRSSGQSSTESR